MVAQRSAAQHSVNDSLRPVAIDHPPVKCSGGSPSASESRVDTGPTAAHATDHFLQIEEYTPSPWARGLKLVTIQRARLAMLPTPVHRLRAPGVPEGAELWVKRDDLTGMQLSGNKVRKLEFLLADAVLRGCDCVIAIGSVQSNCCRAVSVAARYMGLDSHIILRGQEGSGSAEPQDPGVCGNLLLDRLSGAQIHLAEGEFRDAGGTSGNGDAGSEEQQQQELVLQLQAAGRRPYVVESGCSGSLGTWGYIEAAHEILVQTAGRGFTDLAVAACTASTAAGLAVGLALAGSSMRVTALGICATPGELQSEVSRLLDDLGATPALLGVGAEQLLTMQQAKGLGYHRSSDAELRTIMAVAQSTGVVLDPTYSGKALHHMLHGMQQQPQQWRGRKVLFVHTGGLLGMYDKAGQLLPLLEAQHPVQRL